MKNKALRVSCYILSFIVPAAVFLFFLSTNKIVPFGDNTLAVYDLQGQYITLLSYFRSIFLSKENFIYTFSKPIGGDMISLLTYYLFSPFNIFYLFFNNSALPIGISIVTTLKIAAAGLSMFIFMQYKFKNKPLNNLIFAFSYALCSYMIVYNFNIMWIDAVIFLPLVVLGFEKIMLGKKPYFYSAFLAISIISNYYTGFMTCLFIVIFFFYRVYTKERTKTEKKQIYKLFIEGSALAGVLSSISWLSAILAMGGTRTQLGNGDMTSFTQLIKATAFFKNLSGGSFNGIGDIISGAPLIFVGCFSLYLVVLYFANRGISVKERIGTAVAIGLFLVSFFITAINNLWHGGAAPNWFTYRFAFVFSFFMLFVAAQQFNNHLSTMRARDYIFVLGFALLQLLFNLLGKNQNMFFIELPMAIIMLGATYALMKMKKPIIQYACLGVIIGVNLLDMTMSGNANMATNAGSSYHYMSNKEYQKDLEVITPVVDYIKDYDESGNFYRLEKTFYRSSTFNLANNDAFLFNYPGISHFTSSDKLAVREYLGKRLGFHSNNSWNSYGLGSTLGANAFLNIKYIADEDFFYNSILYPNRRFGARNYLTHLKDFPTDTASMIHVFENPYTFGMGFMSKKRDSIYGRQGENIVDEATQEQSTYWYNGYEYLNWFFKDLAYLNDENIYKPAQVSKSYQNITPIDNNHYKLNDLSQKGEITFTITLDEDIDYPYYYSISPRLDNYLTLMDMTAGRNLYYFSYGNHGFNPIERASKTRTYRLIFKEHLIWDNVYINSDFFYEDIDVLKKYTDEFKSNSLEMSASSSSHLKGTVVYDENKPTLMFSIPYEKNWQVKVNGRTVKTKINQDIFLAADLDGLGFTTGDTLQVDITYKANNYIYTSLMGLLGVAYIILIGYVELDKKIKRKRGSKND